MSAPVIGITTYATNENGEFTLPRQYVECVRRAGGTALLMPPGDENVDATLAVCDGFILSGGGDIDPQVYGGVNHDTIYMVDQPRDEMEIALVKSLLEARLPTLAICRGLQIVNVALGGTLHPHIPDVFGESVTHRAPPRKPIMHPLNVASNSRLRSILRSTETAAMSWHHQAIRNLGDDLSVVATAPDGVIEAVEIVGIPNLIAVQWHPELTAANDTAQQELFNELVSMAGKK